MRLPRRLIGTPIRPDRWSALRFASLRWAALPVIDRRWTVPLSAMAVAFGIFVGVAIGPGTEGTLGSQMQTMVQVVPPPADPEPGGQGANGGEPNGGSGGGEPTPTPDPPVDDGPFDSPTTTTTTPPVTSPPITTTTPTTTTTTTTETEDEPEDKPDDEVPTLVKGAVVHTNEYADSYTVARNDGTLTVIHASNLPPIGDVVEVETKTLANGTRAENGDRDQTGQTDRFNLIGTVTFSDPRIGAYTVSVAGSSVLVRVPAGVRMPEVADQVEVRARLMDKVDAIEPLDAGRDGCGTPPNLPKARKYTLEQTGLAVTARAQTTAIEGVVQGVCRKSGSLILSADDVRESGRDIAVVIPSNMRLSEFAAGDVLKVRADIGQSGNFTATSIADDNGEAAADDGGRIQR